MGKFTKDGKIKIPHIIPHTLDFGILDGEKADAALETARREIEEMSPDERKILLANPRVGREIEWLLLFDEADIGLRLIAIAMIAQRELDRDKAAESISPAFLDAEVRRGFELGWISQAVESLEAETDKLRSPDYVTARELAQQIGLSESGVSRIVSRLRAAGLIEAKPRALLSQKDITIVKREAHNNARPGARGKPKRKR